tara:strand:+ start:63 stop:263 length:201 start_codon:yes stop_codon:yes gene_type:complete
MISIFLAMLASGSPYDWQMTCEQTLEAIEVVREDPFFSKPENHRHRNNLIKKMRRHGPPDCVSATV